MNATSVKYKGKEYFKCKQVDEAYFADELTTEEYDELFDYVAIFCEGYVKDLKRHPTEDMINEVTDA